MKKNSFFKSTLILIIGGFITKILGMITRMITSRYLGSTGIGIYSMLMPTFSLLIALSSFGFPIAISKLVSEDRYNNKNILFSVIPISLLINSILIIFLFLTSDFICTHLIHEKRAYLGLISISFVLPFIGISSILRGYFFGKEKMFPHVISNVLEDIVRLLLLITLTPRFLKMGITYAVAFVILTNVISELTSIITFIFFMPKNSSIKKSDLKPRRENIRNVFDISIPSTLSRVIGNIGYFFEPIILTTILLSLNYKSSFITTEYGIIAGFVIPLLLLPSFFTTAISNALIPVISKAYSNNNKKEVKRKLRQAIIFSLMIGIPATIFFMLFPSQILMFLYKTNEGILYTRILAPFLLIQYIQAPLISALNAMGKAKASLCSTVIGTITKVISLIIFTYLFNIWGLVLSIIINILVVTRYQYKKVKSYL